MRKWFRKLRRARFRYESLITIFIHRDRILHNLGEFRRAYPKLAIAPVLKSNAYGHGLVPVAEILQNEPLPFFCVDSYPEALILRNEGIATPLLILGYTPHENIERSKLKNVSFGITSMEELRRIATRPVGDRGGNFGGANFLDMRSAPITIHLKLDTGMHRQGILMNELDEAIELIRRAPYITLDGMYSHLADAEAPASPFTKLQIEAWNKAVHAVRHAIPGVRYFHLSNTAGSYHTARIDANVMRLGIGLYGFNTSANQQLDLRPALEMRTRITSLRTIERGEKVGYGGTFAAADTMTIATIPVGYAEGIDRRLSNQGWVSVNGILCPMVGRINMNISSIDVSMIPHPHIDDEVVAISADAKAQNSIAHMAKLCDTIPYEILTHLPSQLRRTVIE